MGIRVLIVDDHLVVRRGLRFFLDRQEDIEIVGEAGNGEEAVCLAMETQPDIVLMDLVMPGMDGVEATKQMLSKLPATRVIMLSSFSDQDHIIPAIRAGVSGYQLKDIEPDELARVIKSVYNGEKKLHTAVTSELMTHMTGWQENEEHRIKQLTHREREVLRQIASGKSNKEIADILVITEQTVKTHVSNILSKLQVQDRTQAAIYAIQHPDV
ncbi:response regulator transcription factor [Paenibacillus sp.]|jgi:DNA-binding NarL/FixJ family response regulator|uniref:response regulator transcription factor n=1 Tax=Paenibacillus sp. TaxID=58172 RepID=UPI0028380D72|nr:response regulator transcription factor [Paenibacillus sp.]MDR0268661.1 response regulator transcription factor [Paenibacillus sp.]